MQKPLLLTKKQIKLEQLTHKKFEPVKNYFDTHKDDLFDEANTSFSNALITLYNENYKNLDVLRVSSAFIRGELFGKIIMP